MTVLLATVERAGYATVQDGGRPGLTQVGVPASGPFHRQRYLAATALLSGSPDARRPAIEVLAGDLHLRMASESVLALVGPATLDVDGSAGAVGAALRVPSGARVRVAPLGPGPVYLVVAGWAPQRVLGSAATDTFSRLGGGLLTAGTTLQGSPDDGSWGRVGAFHRALAVETGPLRVASADHPALADLIGSPWSVASVARSGVRLSGGALPVQRSVASMPVVVGAVQATPDGSAIILGPDGGLTGGYPVVAVVASVDLDRLSMLAPGDRVTFQAVGVADATRAWDDRERYLERATAHPDLLP